MARWIGVLFAAVLTTSALAQSTIGFASLNESVAEDAGTLQLSVVRSGSLSGSASVQYTTIGTSAVDGTDYTAVSGTLTFADQESQKNIALPLLDDSVSDTINPRTIEVELSNPSAGVTLGQFDSHFIYVSDDEPPPPPHEFSYGNLTHAEGDGTTVSYITVTLNRPHTQTILYGFRGYTPPNANDYNNARVFITTGVTFQPGETTKQVPIEIRGNDAYESVTKTFHFTPMPGPVSVLSPDFEITLTEDDPQPTVSIADYSLLEGSCEPAGLQVVLTTDYPANGIVHWSMSDGTATAADIDYGPFGIYQPVQFLNSTTATLTLAAAYGDLKIEPDETFGITLTSATNMTIGDGSATITIENDDQELPSFQENLVRVEAGKSTTLHIRFPAPAPAGTVQLSSSDASVKVPASVAVPDQAMSVTFNADTTAPVGPVLVTAKLPNALGATQVTTTVDAYRDSDLHFDRSRRAAFPGETATASLELMPPRDQAATVQLSSSSGIVAPSSVIVPAGDSVTFPFTSLAAGTGWITASYGETSQSLIVEVVAQRVTSFSPEVAPTTGGSVVTLKGLGFSSGCTASFGGDAAQTTFVDSETLLAKTPAHAADTVDVTITCGLTPVTSAQQFRFAKTKQRSARH